MSRKRSHAAAAWRSHAGRGCNVHSRVIDSYCPLAGMASRGSPVQRMTPAMQQYHRMKSECEDAILFFRMGDFYEMFYEDAEVASRVLGLALTSRNKGPDATPMAGVPYHAADTYIGRLLRAGYKVAICEQVQDPKDAKGVVDRAVTRVITPGTLTDEEFLEAKENNYLAAVWHNGAEAGLAWVEISTGDFEVEELRDSEVLNELGRLSPAECLVSEEDEELAERVGRLAGTAVTLRPDWTFERRNARTKLTSLLGTRGLEGFGVEGMEAGVRAAGAIVDYLEETHKAPLGHVRGISPFYGSEYLAMDDATKRALELVETAVGRERRGSLLWVMDKTLTPMGGRMLRKWLMLPLRRVEEIRRRQQAVEDLFDDPARREELREVLGEMADMERIAAKIASERANGRDLLWLGRSLSLLPEMKRALDGCTSEFLADLSDGMEMLEDVRELIDEAISPEAPPTLRDGGIIRDGYSEELGEIRSITRDGRSWITRFQEEEAKRSGIPSLKVGFNRVFGYYIEVTNTHSEKVPGDYVRKQTLKNAERYITPELKEYENRVLTADERGKELEYKLFVEVRNRVAGAAEKIMKAGEKVARVDVIAGLAAAAAENSYTKPEVTDEEAIEIRDGRHPVLEKTLTDEAFVPNDTLLDGKENRLLIITGPNMAGKSTYVRQVALLVLMAQTGSFIPAKSARIGVADRIFARVGASDEISKGQSTFMVEMIEAANILNNASPKSLVVLDEIGRGTSTFDGISIAWAVAEYIHERVGAKTLFATHYHELTELASVLEGAVNCNVAVREWGEEIVFIRKILRGSADRSYGIHVAKLAGVPKDVVERAAEILENLEKQSLEAGHRKAGVPGKGKPRAKLAQLTLFRLETHPALEELRKLDTDKLSPLEAFLKLKELRDMAKEEGDGGAKAHKD